MEMKFGLLADAANESREGKLNITGEFSGIWAQRVPATHPSLVLVARFEAQVSEGSSHKATVALVDEDGKTLIPPNTEIPLNFLASGPGRPLRAQLILQVAPLQLNTFGEFEFHLLVDGRHVGSVPFSVHQLNRLP